MLYYVNPYRNGYAYYPVPYSFYWAPSWCSGSYYPPMQRGFIPIGTTPINYRQQITVDSVPLQVQTIEPPKFSLSYPFISKEAMEGQQGMPPQPPMQGPFMPAPIPNPPPGRPPHMQGPMMQPPPPQPPQTPPGQGMGQQDQNMQGNNQQGQGNQGQQGPMAPGQGPGRIDQGPPRPPQQQPPRPPMPQPQQQPAPPPPQPPQQPPRPPQQPPMPPQTPPMQAVPLPQGPGPVISGSLSEEVIDRINDGIKEAVLEAFGENVLLDEVTNFTEIYNTYEVTLNEKGVLSILFNMYTFRQGAANGNSVYYSLTLNTNTGEEYDFEDLFNPRINYIQELNQLANEYISDENIELIDTFPGVAEDQQFYLTPDSFVLYYQPGLYTPAYRDLLKIEIPYEDIQNLITPLSPISRLI